MIKVKLEYNKEKGRYKIVFIDIDIPIDIRQKLEKLGYEVYIKDTKKYTEFCITVAGYESCYRYNVYSSKSDIAALNSYLAEYKEKFNEVFLENNPNELITIGIVLWVIF